MVRSLAILMFVSSVLVLHSPTYAQTTGADPGSINNNPTSTSGKVNCWTFRNIAGNHAIAIQITDDASAVFRQYSYGGSGPNAKFSSTPTVIMDGATALAGQNVVCVRLSPKTSAKNSIYYEMYFDKVGGGSIKLGVIRFIRGNTGRSSSTVVVRLAKDVIVGAPDPCSEPVDDITEEEEVDANTINSSIDSTILSKAFTAATQAIP